MLLKEKLWRAYTTVPDLQISLDIKQLVSGPKIEMFLDVPTEEEATVLQRTLEQAKKESGLYKLTYSWHENKSEPGKTCVIMLERDFSYSEASLFSVATGISGGSASLTRSKEMEADRALDGINEKMFCYLYDEVLASHGIEVHRRRFNEHRGRLS